ncbi:M protein, serotype 24 precursor, putative [Perkinsus marinus ATCC 50983]|uniref:M protein, serotype 24, putative n=1 Tax=Perkinsus marinus (strain ATCC 50983 / TXsc) TaxID=423536 RepID=C5L3Z5_PERM5|nr:M protein, serotype 24 precursor, putative [Perkinsus marinus ATCC 50983]EER08724.1 M protein, serotype 24 precursor, putative [Perkinsus marinus ATCC 50983]|eukprot:XP_002776908.1 M protein, serotype 24 precursor, putative [Perkinsus marinus ATCC 50983]
MPVEGESVEERAKPTRSYAYVPEEPSGQQGGSVRKDLGKAPRGDAGGQGSGMRRSVSFAKKTGVVETRSTPSAAKATAASDAPIAPRRSISYASALPAEFMDSSGGLKMGSQANEASIEKQLTAKMIYLRNQYWTEITELRDKMRNMAPYMMDAVNECLFNEEPRYTFEPDEFMAEHQLEYVEAVIREKTKLVATKCSAAAKLQIDKTVKLLQEARANLIRVQKKVADLEATNEALEKKVDILRNQLKQSQRQTGTSRGGGSSSGTGGGTSSSSTEEKEEMDMGERLIEAEDRIAELQLMINRLEQERFLAEGDAEALMMAKSGMDAMGAQEETARVARLEEELEEARAEAARWKQAFETSDFKLNVATQDLDALQRKFDTGVGGLEGHCKDLESELAATRRALEEANEASAKRIEAAMKSLQAANGELQRQLAETKKEKEIWERKAEVAEREAEAAREAALENRAREPSAVPIAESAGGGGREAEKIKQLERELARSVEKLKTVQEKQGEGESVSIREECEEWRERAERAEAELEKLRAGYEAFTGFEVGWSGKLRIGGRRDGDEETRRESRLKSLDETTRRRQMHTPEEIDGDFCS